MLGRLQEKYREGTLWLYLRDRLAGLGLDVRLFYWVEERLQDIPRHSLDPSMEVFRLGKADIEALPLDSGDRSSDQVTYYLRRLELEGMRCYGLRRGDDVLAFSWVNTHECHIDIHRCAMQEGEAYLYDMYTMKPYRGQGLAPVLRTCVATELGKEGFNRFYSVSELYNRPSIRFKHKLGAHFKSLHLVVNLFGRRLLNLKLREYPAPKGG